MKIAFVSQPIDTIIPPYQNSVGACTYWVARLLAQSAEVVVYGLTDNHENLAPMAEESGIDFRFFPATQWISGYTPYKGNWPNSFRARRPFPPPGGCFLITGAKWQKT